jgi:hypothetical protein
MQLQSVIRENIIKQVYSFLGMDASFLRESPATNGVHFTVYSILTIRACTYQFQSAFFSCFDFSRLGASSVVGLWDDGVDDVLVDVAAG